MEIVTNLTIEAASGATYTTERYARKPDPRLYAARAERAPHGDTWFIIGDGRRDTAPLQFDVTIRASDLREAEGELQELVGVLEDATLVRWGPYQRAILAPESIIPVPVQGGYRVQVSLWPSGPAWQDDLGNDVTL